MHLYRIAARSYIGSLGMEAFVLVRLISVDLPLSLRSFFFFSLSIPYSPSCSRTRHSPVHARPPPKSTPHVLRSKRGKLCLSLLPLLSLFIVFLFVFLTFCLFLPSSSSFPIFPSSLVSRKYVSARSVGVRYDSFHYHTIIFCRHS